MPECYGIFPYIYHKKSTNYRKIYQLFCPPSWKPGCWRICCNCCCISRLRCISRLCCMESGKLDLGRFQFCIIMSFLDDLWFKKWSFDMYPQKPYLMINLGISTWYTFETYSICVYIEYISILYLHYHFKKCVSFSSSCQVPLRFGLHFLALSWWQLKKSGDEKTTWHLEKNPGK